MTTGSQVGGKAADGEWAKQVGIVFRCWLRSHRPVTIGQICHIELSSRYIIVNKYPPMISKTLPEAQRTQGIDSKT